MARKRPSDNTLERVYAYVRHQSGIVQTHAVAAYYAIPIDLARHILDVLVYDQMLDRTSRGYVTRAHATLGRRGPLGDGGSLDSEPSAADAATAQIPDLAVAASGAQSLVSYWLDRRSRAAQDTIGVGDIEELVALLEGRFAP